MANEDRVGSVRVVEDSANVFEFWVGDDRVPSAGPLTRAAFGVGAPFTLIGSLSATTNFATLSLQVTDLEGNALAGRKPIRVFPHNNAFAAVAVTWTSTATGVLTSTTTATELSYWTDANGALQTRLGTGAAVPNFACALGCGFVYGNAAAISVPG